MLTSTVVRHAAMLGRVTYYAVRENIFCYTRNNIHTHTHTHTHTHAQTDRHTHTHALDPVKTHISNQLVFNCVAWVSPVVFCPQMPHKFFVSAFVLLCLIGCCSCLLSDCMFSVSLKHRKITLLALSIDSRKGYDTNFLRS